MELYKTFFFGLICLINCVLLVRQQATTRFKNQFDLKKNVSSEVPMERILGGYPSNQGEYPFMAAIFVHRKYSCAGALITENHILTAGHCFQLSNGFVIRKNHVQVALGIIQLQTTVKALVLQRIDNVYVHPSLSYNSVNEIILPIYDIAVIQLESNVTSTPNIMPLHLPEQGQQFLNYTAVLAGWGATSESIKRPSNNLLYTTVKIIDYETCLQTPLKRHFSRVLLLDTVLCAFGGKNDGCRGDSGAPLIIRQGLNKMEIAGIMSWGVGCGNRRYPAVYTNVSYFLDWIHNVTKLTD